MSQYAQQPAPEYGYESYAIPAAEAPALERAAFIKRTYAHLALAILAFMGVTALLLNMPGIDSLMERFRGIRYGWLAVVGLFMVGSWVAERWARSDSSPAMQYVGLGLYVVLEALIFTPLLWMATTFPQFDGVVPQAALMTLGVAGGLMIAVLITRQDFSFLGPILSIAFLVTFGLILAAVLFGFNLGLLFSFAMVALACGAILYQTSNVLHHYHTKQHVAAALALFAAVALLFWYILQIFMRNRN